MHGGSPKGTEKSGGLDVEAEEYTEEVQKEQERAVDWTLKRRKGTRKSKRNKYVHGNSRQEQASVPTDRGYQLMLPHMPLQGPAHAPEEVWVLLLWLPQP